ncbi:hypothetical protein Dsin_021505 [Dipteronia sinensis]|uniref:Pentatricopeptide repeat-containing protein n=1 Tax=Dipteronia sinensis TaxID=43782 RepID=A0AAD9ZZS9_9ROSI|nr:hypothetical protein Dsin_021505 [Dipteronia sinensis]
MATQLRLVRKLLHHSVPPHRHRKNPLSFTSCLSLCTDSSTTHQELEEQVRKLQILLQEACTTAADNLIKTLILSKKSSPNGLFTLFSVSSPSLKPLFTDMLLSVLSSSKMPVEALQLYSSVRNDGGFPSLDSLNVFLECLVTCNRFDNTLELFEDIVDSGFQADKFTYGKAVQAAVKMEKKMRDSEKLFDEMCKRNLLPTLVTYNTLMDGYCKAAELDKAIGLKERMEIDNVEAISLHSIPCLVGFVKAKRIKEAKRVWKEMEANGIMPDSVLLNSLCKHGKIEKAEEILGKEMGNGLVPNDVVFNTIVNGYCRKGDINRAIFTIELMENHGVRPDCITFNSLINKFCEIREMDTAEKWILEEMKYHGTKPNVVSFGSLVDCLCKVGNLVEVEMVLRDMEGKGVSPNSRIYNMLIAGTCSMGRIKDVFRFFDKMVQSKIAPTLATYNVLINGLCKKARIMEAEVLLNQIISTGLSPDVITYNSLISGYSSAGKTQKCLELYENMKKLGIKPSLKTFHPLLSGCSKEGIVIVEKLFSEMLQLDLSPDLVVYNALIHCYTEHGDL